MAWIYTDDDSMQHVRRLEGQCWQLIEMATHDPEEDLFQVYIGDVDVAQYINNEREELSRILETYGYPSVEFVLREFSGNFAYQVIAECIFEHYNTRYARRLFVGGEDECVEYIENYIEETGGKEV